MVMKKMTNKTKRVFVKMLLVLFVMAIIVSGFLFLSYLQSRPSQDIKEQCKVENKKYQQRDVYVITPKQEKKSDKIILYIHGGSYIGTLIKEHWDFLKDIATDTGYTIIVPDYPLAPQSNYEDVFSFMEPLYKEVVEKVTSEKLILMGDSAGGGLSLALAQKMGEERVEQPSKLLLLSPWLDVTMSNPKIREIEREDPILSVISLKAAGVAYAGLEGMNSYLVNPIKGPVENLKKVVLFTGTYDVLNPDAHKLVERAKRQGITITLKETSGAQHVWMLGKYKKVYQAEEGYKQVIEELKDVNQNE